ncbi:MAG: 16S rRNA (guanine(527)-N(7))-methyltransferase RsmG [Alphaproteobacteria bacterium]
MTTPEEFQKAANVSRETLDKFQIYHDLLLTWQKTINLIGPGTEKDIWGRHFLDSAQILGLVNEAGLKKKRSWLDIGAGAGFPGLVLSLLGEDKVFLAEPNPKKCAFLRAVCRATGAGAEILQSKVEDLSPFPVNIVTSRALAPVEQLLEWGAPFLAEGGEFWLLKGETGDQELTSAMKNNNMKSEIFQSLTDKTGKILRIRK